MSFFSFLIEYYIWIMIVLVLLIVTVIGFLVDNSKKNLTNNNSDSLQISDNKTNNTASNGNSTVSFDDIFSQDETAVADSQSLNGAGDSIQNSINGINVSSNVAMNSSSQNMDSSVSNVNSNSNLSNNNSIFPEPVVSSDSVVTNGTHDVSQSNVNVNNVSSQSVVSQNGLSSVFTSTDTQQSNHTDIFSNGGKV